MIGYWSNLGRDDIGKMDKQNSIVLVPVSSIEQHGPHLPVGTDTIILEKVMEKFVAEKDFQGFNVIVAPQLPIGKSNEHMDFSGTITLTSKTMYSVIFEICSCIVKHGFKKLIFMNSHGGNTDLLNLMARDLRIELNAEFYVFDWWFTPFWSDIMKEEKASYSRYGVFHACELETSLMMAIANDTVKTDKIINEVPDEMFKGNNFITILGPYLLGWKTNDISSSGVIGEPVCATKEKGERFLQYAVDKLEDILKEIINFKYI